MWFIVLWEKKNTMSVQKKSCEKKILWKNEPVLEFFIMINKGKYKHKKRGNMIFITISLIDPIMWLYWNGYAQNYHI